MNVQDMFTRLQTKLGNLAPEFELYYKAELAVEILELKQQRNAVILGTTTWSQRSSIPFPTLPATHLT